MERERLLLLMRRRLEWGLIAILFWMLLPTPAHGGGFSYRLPTPDSDPGTWRTVVGVMRYHTVAPKETLLDIARKYGLGFNELRILYPRMDPWIPERGTQLTIPTRWVLPPTRLEGIVINLPELRLYRFFPRIHMVKTYPIGIGDQGWETPEGTYRIVDRKEDPTWVIPPSLRPKYGAARIPPGPRNPLGKYWLGISLDGYGIHGTNFPWGVGRLVSHGCIRLYPEHIVQLFQEVEVGTPVEIIYEPVKIGFERGRIYIEVHPDPYGKRSNLEEETKIRLQKMGLWGYISIERFHV